MWCKVEDEGKDRKEVKRFVGKSLPFFSVNIPWDFNVVCRQSICWMLCNKGKHSQHWARYINQ